MIGAATRQYVAWRSAAVAVTALPRPLDPAVTGALGRLAYAGSARAREAVLANLDVIAPECAAEERERLARRVFIHQARNYLDTCRLPRLSLEREAHRIEVSGWEHVEAARARGRGTLIASAHYGPIPLVGTVAARDLRILIVAEAISPRLFDLLNRSLRGAFGATFVPATALLTLLRALRRGGTVGLLADRPVTGGGMRAPFFGRDALLPVGHLVLATRSGATLLPGFALGGGRPRGEILPPLQLVDGRDEEAKLENLRRWVAILERLIRAAPDEWTVFERVWEL